MERLASPRLVSYFFFVSEREYSAIAHPQEGVVFLEAPFGRAVNQPSDPTV
jgi:hypothetical protein